MKTSRAILILGGLALITLTACMNLGTSKSTRFYLLESMDTATVDATGSLETAQLSIGVGPVSIPSYLDRPQIVTRIDGHELLVDDFHQWAEPLKVSITRVMAENLTVSTGVRNVHRHPWARAVAIDIKTAIDVLRFDADAQGLVTLSAVWRIVYPESQRQLIEKRSTITLQTNGKDTAQVVEAMSAALATLSQEITAALHEVSSRESDASTLD
jgi:uncharacterized lipoprotein YmbA